MTKRKTVENEAEQGTYEEEFSVSGEKLLQKIKELIKEGNARRIIIKGSEGNTLLEFPLTVGAAAGVIGVAFMPILVAIGAIAAVVTKCTVVVVKK